MPSAMLQFGAEGFHRPCRPTTAEKVVVSSKDRRVQGQGQRYDWPIVDIVWSSPPSNCLQSGVCRTGNNLDNPTVDHIADCGMQQTGLLGCEATPFHDQGVGSC